MGWWEYLFSGNTRNSRTGQTLSSTHEAFSLPTSSPHPDAFDPEMLSPEPESSSGQYTYPPQSGGSYDYAPALNGSRSRQASLLPLHHNLSHSPPSPPQNYPPLAHTWARLRSWLTREYPELGDTLNYGILPQDLTQIEVAFGFDLPAVVRESYLAVDGQEAESSAGCPEGLFFGLTLLPLEDVLEEWRFWRDVDEDPSTGANPRLQEVMQSLPPGWIRLQYSQRGWIPLIADKAGNYIGIDLNPAEAGSVGQVIVFGRDFDTKVVMWKGDGPTGWAKWLASFVDDLESGEGFEIGQPNEQSEGSEDGVGYESYFYDGNGRGQGDGGGETGTGGGLRFTGEYRGWSPLEAWADRSVRKWYEAGAIPDLTPIEQSDKGKTTESVGLGVLDLAGQGAVEVPIPVLAVVKDGHDVRLQSSSAGPNGSTLSQNVPTISVTKPPAPLPVSLPTADDIEVSPTPSVASSFNSDLEAGHGVGMREVSRKHDPVFAPRRPSPGKSPRMHRKVDPLSSTPPAELVDISSSPKLLPDLLTDADPAQLGTSSMRPATPTRSDAGDVHTAHVEGAGDQNGSPEVETTIRLVGGGGSTGPADTISLPVGDNVLVGGDEPEPFPDATSSASNNPVTKAKPEKKKTLASGLKKLGNLGAGKRRQELSSTAKEDN